MEDAAADSLQDKGIGSRVQSQELLESSSASSLSVFADHSDGQGRAFRANDSARKLDSSSPRASMDEALKSEAAFIQYVMSIPPKQQERPACEHHRSADSMHRSPAGGATTKVGLDHLDNLCKLMEQLSELRDTNSKLQKRVQYLEDLKTLHDMHKEICEGGEEYSSEDALAEKQQQQQQMPYKLTKSATESHCVKEESSRSPSRYLSRRSRSGGQQQQTGRRCRSKSVGHEDLGEDPKSRRLFPKWSRVKEAFGWESERKGSIKVKEECGTVLGSRRRSDESRQMYRHAASPTWYQQSPSIHSSIGEIDVDFEEERWKKMSVSSEKYVSHLEAPHESLRRQKSTPSPGSDKLTSYRDSTDLKAKASTIERDSYRNQDFSKFDKDECKRGKSPWGRVKTIIERHRDSIKRRSLRRDHSDCDVPLGKNHSDASLDFADYLNAKNLKQKGSKPPPIILEPEEGSGSHSPGSSPGQQRKSRWNRMTKAWKGKKDGERDHQSLSTPTSPNNNEDGNFTFDAIEENSPDSYSEGRELSRVGSDSHVHQLALSVSSSDLMAQLQRNLSEDFYRKIQEWERIRATPQQQPAPDHHPPVKPAKATKIKDLTWLEKELQKIEKEKQRLAKERRKYEEREQRLEKLKESVMKNSSSSSKREVLVKTSAGEFRFEGISDAFTKKLYEWETKRGVGPELSTLALLDSSRLCSSGPVLQMSRVLSRSESSVAEMGQGSHNSSNSLPSVKCAEEVVVDRQTSRANSEPDLNALAVMANGASLAVTKTARLKKEEDITIPVPISKEEEEFEEPGGRKGSYIGLLEENVILLDQLREKEDICRRLEKDLEILDEKMDEMHGRHVQETQRYREKLWEMHQQGASPRDVPGCRHYMMQLRKRIEYLESWTDKLRSERETVEVNFRHHSKEQETMTLDLLEKMRELQAAGTFKQDCGTKRDSQLDTCALERLQDLSALLTKQTQNLEKTMSHKTRQICQLKWELLNRDLTSVKKETEQHVHSSALRKRSKYAQWRSRSSEESSAVACQTKPCDSNYIEMKTKLYSNNSSDDDLTATHLANTVQELNKEVLKLASGTSCNSLSKYLEEVEKYSSVQSSTRSLEQPRNSKKLQTTPTKEHPKKITVRRSSADNLCSSSEIRAKKDNTSSTYSDDSSDEYYSRVCYTNNTGFRDTERLLMSYGEVSPRVVGQHALRKRKVSRLLGRKRSNTFHTNRDLQKPQQKCHQPPQKCQSFREPREKVDGSERKTPPYLRRKQQQQHQSERDIEEEVKRKISEERILQQVISLGNLEVLRNYESNWLREVSSDSKIPVLVEALERDVVVEGVGKSPARSLSEKTKKETAVERREHLQKKRSKKRLKSPDALVPAKVGQNPISNSTSTDSLNSKKVDKNSNSSGLKSSFRKSTNSDSSQKNSSEKENCRTEPESSRKKLHSPTNEVPTVTIQLPKRKQRKTSKDAAITEEHTVTINMPKKRSFSSEKDSSISDHSMIETPKLPHSDQTPQPSDTSSNHTHSESTEENIKLMRLVSLEKFESPFSKVSQPRKRKAEDEEFDRSNTPTEEMKDMLTVRRNVNSVAKSSTTANIERTNNDNDESICLKSPSAPQLHWRKVCAKKVTKPGAPNVRNLIERYNQKVAESQVYKSPLSSNVSSPASIRKISSPVSGSATPDYIPRFCSTPNSPSNYSPLSSPLHFKTSNSSFSKSPPSSPRSEALRLAKEKFIASQQKGSNSPQTIDSSQQPTFPKSVDLADRVSCSSMDSMNLVMIRAGENCRESRMRSGNDNAVARAAAAAASADDEKQQQQPLKTSKSLSSSSIFKAVMNSDFKMPTNLLRLKRSKRKKDMAAVTELCRQSLLLTTDDVKNIPTAAAHKSCPSSPELKSKNVVKSTWLQRNIFRHK